MRHIFFQIVLLLPLLINAQTGTVWYFGQKAGLDFNYTPPKPIYDGKIDQIEGCAVICDDYGKILLYSEGSNLWNRKHNIVQNGSGLGGHPSATQSGIIVPLPGSTDKYYVFSVDYELKSGGLQYAIVDMSKNGGDGEVISKNNKLKTPITEKITAVQHSNGIDYWILSHEYGNNTFLAYLLTSSGLNSTPVKSNVGKNHVTSQGQGSIKANIAGNTVVITDMLEYLIEIFDFNSSTGKLSNPITLNGSDYNRVYGVEFSLDGSKLYVTRQQNPCRIYQFDLSLRNLSSISASRKLLYEINVDYGLGALQMAPDGKIYCNQRNTSNPSKYLAIIAAPDSAYPKCNFIPNAIDLSPGMSWSGLPNFVSSIVYNEQIIVSNKCQGDSTQFEIVSKNIDSCIWTFGDQHNTTSKKLSTSFKYLDSGLYNVVLTFYRKGISYNRSIPVYIIGNKFKILPKDTIFCNLTSVSIEANKMEATKIKWFDNDTSFIKTFYQAGSYPYSFSTIQGCSFKDSIQIFITNNTSNSLGNDTSICEGDSLILDAGPSNWTQWNTLENTRFIVVKNDGFYSFQKNSTCGIDKDTIKITIIPKKYTYNLQDTLMCNSNSITLSSSINGSTKWNTNETTKSIQVSQPNKYWAITTNGCDVKIDTFNVGQIKSLNLFTNKDTLVCINDTLVLNYTYDFPFTWNNNNTSRIVKIQFPDSLISISIDTMGCKVTDTLFINYVPFEKFNFSDSLKICEGEFIVIGPSHSKIKFIWNDNTLGVKTLRSEGNYDIIINSVCESTIKSFDVFKENCSCIILIPNAFTPNLDFLNDNFKPILNCTIPDYTFRIYTLYGEKIFESYNQFESWDGTYKSSESNYMNVFMWTLDVLDPFENKLRQLNGTVSLIK